MTDAPGHKPGLDSISLILVVEDEPTANRLHEVLDRPEGTRFEITRVLRVEEALLRLHETHFDAMLLDLSVQEADGLDSLMRASAAARSIPIVVLTYQRDEATALKAARAGAQDYLTKGEVTPELISRTLLHAIERHRILQELTEAQQRHRFLATHDALTELPNRYWFIEQLKMLITAADRSASRFAVFFFDLDGFKAVNDNLGHAIGDELLSDVARRLKRSMRRSDVVARIGGDEFLSAMQDVPDSDSIARVADSIRLEIEKPYHVGDHECWISASVGIAIFPDHGTTADELIQNADTAMYEAKTSGKNCVCLFDPDMNEKAVERFKLVNGLREAIRAGQLQLVFQPQIRTATEEIVGVETLVRWSHPTRGIVSPKDFIHVAEETGVMVDLGEWVLRSACEAAMSWESLGQARVAVNISGRQLEQENFAERVQRILDEVGLPAGRLELELTESLAASESTLRAVAELRRLGIRVAIDDFGTGYSSLTMLKRLDVDVLKIDQSFVRGAALTDPDRVILEGIVHIALGLGVEVVAEGVESVEEMRFLMDRGCTAMQGYLFSKPVDRKQIDALGRDPEAEWRRVLADPESWRPPEPEAGPDAPAGPTAIGRLGRRPDVHSDPDEHLYPALKEDPEEDS